MESSDSSGYNSYELMTPIFDFHLVISVLTTPTLMPISLLAKVSP